MRLNHRGHALLDAFVTLEFDVVNTGTQLTLAKGGKTSIVDLLSLMSRSIYFVDPRLMRNMLDWKVSCRYSGSNHFDILYHLQGTKRRVKNFGSRK